MGRRKSMGKRETSRTLERGRAWRKEGKRRGKSKSGGNIKREKERKNLGWVTDA